MTWREKFCSQCGQPLSDVMEKLALEEAQVRSVSATNDWVQEDEDRRYRARAEEGSGT